MSTEIFVLNWISVTVFVIYVPGMWYRDRNRERKEQNKNNPEVRNVSKVL